MRVKDQIFSNDTIFLDGIEFDGCRFVGCKIIYRGEKPTALRDNSLEDCEFAFEGPASLTMGFLKGMVDSSDGFLVTILKAFALDPARLERLSTQPAIPVAAAARSEADAPSSVSRPH